MKKIIFFIFISFTLTLLITGCGGENEMFSQANSELTQSAIEYVNKYKEDMVYQVNEGNFSELEPYLIPNTTFYHLLRRHVNDLQQERSTLTLIEHTVSDVLVNEDAVLHVHAYEVTEKTDRRGEKTIEENNITYEMVEHNESFRIVSIMKR
ncbi:TcaA NTF2-like domain-containing protein [Alkalihalobacterium elongatum]|uniref:TcaA NTF2-like domain-containing protein n=1 Tax=Alkalihalobacterium elongatum TaxID=2675466 RepID=UPI001C1FB108|nr:hypothetical protein [Alkalihalobacterium elongatum]